MLLYSSKDFDYQNQHKTSISKFEKINNLYAHKKQELDELTYEVELIAQCQFTVYKNNIFYEHMTADCNDACKWLSALESNTINGEKLDKRKSYKEKEKFKSLESSISHYLGVPIKIIDIYDYCFGEAWEIRFMFNEQKYAISIPVVKEVTLRSFKDSGEYCFLIKLERHDKNYYGVGETIGSTFMETELKDIFASWLDKQDKDNKKV